MPFVHGRNYRYAILKQRRLAYEIAHAHPADNSLHVLLSAADARTVIEAAWGRRFAVPSMVPLGWVSLAISDIDLLRRGPMLT